MPVIQTVAGGAKFIDFRTESTRAPVPA